MQRCNYVSMITDEARERVAGWFTGRLPAEWQTAPADITIDEASATAEVPASSSVSNLGSNKGIGG